MKSICDKCDYIIDRDKVLEGETVEEYRNIYGTHCPNCGHFIKTLSKPKFMKEKEFELEMLRNQVREKIKEKMNKEKNNVY